MVNQEKRHSALSGNTHDVNTQTKGHTMQAAKFQQLMKSIENTFSGTNCKYSEDQIVDMYGAYNHAAQQGYITEQSFVSACLDWQAFQEWQPNIGQLIKAANQLCRSRPADFGVVNVKWVKADVETESKMPQHVKDRFHELRAEVAKRKAEDEKKRKELMDELQAESKITGVEQRTRKPLTKAEIQEKHMEFIREYNEKHYYPDGTKRRGELISSTPMKIGERAVNVLVYEDGNTYVSGLPDEEELRRMQECPTNNGDF
jgi:hypothetical protein